MPKASQMATSTRPTNCVWHDALWQVASKQVEGLRFHSNHIYLSMCVFVSRPRQIEHVIRSPL